MSQIYFHPSVTLHAQQYLETCLPALSRQQLPDGWSIVPSSENTWVACHANGSNPTTHDLFFKLFYQRNRWEFVKALGRGSRAKRARIQGDRLRGHGFVAPATWCWGKIDQHEFLVSQGMAGIGLADYIYSHWQRPLDSFQLATKRKIIVLLATELARLHQSGWIHGDLRPNNILIHHEQQIPCFCFIDNERNRLYRHAPPVRSIVKNLVQLNMIFPTVLSKTDRLRFFRQYSLERDLSGKIMYQIMNQVITITKRRMHNKVFQDSQN